MCNCINPHPSCTLEKALDLTVFVKVYFSFSHLSWLFWVNTCIGDVAPSRQHNILHLNFLFHLHLLHLIIICPIEYFKIIIKIIHRYLDIKKGISVKKVFVLRTLMPFTLAGDSSRSLQIELKRKLNRTLKLSDKKKFEYFETNIRIYSVASLAIMAIRILPALSPKLEMEECSSLMH